jgi:hypothetical protein
VPKPLRMNRKILARLKEAEEALRQAVKPDGRCAWSNEEKEAARPYLETWCRMPITDAIRMIEGGDDY